MFTSAGNSIVRLALSGGLPQLKDAGFHLAQHGLIMVAETGTECMVLSRARRREEKRSRGPSELAIARNHEILSFRSN
jgi:hypothetical protein